MEGEESLFLMDLENPSLLENHNVGEIPRKDSPRQIKANPDLGRRDLIRKGC